jgi:hypothetical protein
MLAAWSAARFRESEFWARPEKDSAIENATSAASVFFIVKIPFCLF